MKNRKGKESDPSYDTNPYTSENSFKSKATIRHNYTRPEKGGAYCFAPVGRLVGRSVGMSVYINVVQLITQEGFVPKASNSVGR